MATEPRLFKVGDKVQTRGGRPARIVCGDRDGDLPLVVLIQEGNSPSERVVCYRRDGRYHEENVESRWDLVPLPKKVTVWVVIRPGGIVTAYPDEPLHVKEWVNAPVAVYKLELEEGHFDVQD